jgi:hypothetical protein
MARAIVLHRMKSLTLLLAGPVLIGATVGAPLGWEHVIRRAVALPAVLIGMTVLLVPALYILLALAKSAPPASVFLGSAWSSMSTMGTVLLGFVLPYAFLTSSSESLAIHTRMAVMVVLLAVSMGLVGMYRSLMSGRAGNKLAWLFFVGWSLTGIALGAYVLGSTLAI